MKLTIKQGSFLNEDADAILIPSNATGVFLGEVLEEIKAVAGEEVEEAALAEAPVHVGDAIATTAGLLRCKAIIHAPVSEYPEGKTDEHDVYSAVVAGLDLAETNLFEKLALPLRWNIPTAQASGAVLRAIIQHEAVSLKEIVLEDIEEALVHAWEAQKKAYKL